MGTNAMTAGAVALPQSEILPMKITADTVRAWREAGRWGMAGTDMQVLLRLLAVVEADGPLTVMAPALPCLQGGAA